MSRRLPWSRFRTRGCCATVPRWDWWFLAEEYRLLRIRLNCVAAGSVSAAAEDSGSHYLSRLLLGWWFAPCGWSARPPVSPWAAETPDCGTRSSQECWIWTPSSSKVCGKSCRCRWGIVSQACRWYQRDVRDCPAYLQRCAKRKALLPRCEALPLGSIPIAARSSSLIIALYLCCFSPTESSPAPYPRQSSSASPNYPKSQSPTTHCCCSESEWTASTWSFRPRQTTPSASSSRDSSARKSYSATADCTCPTYEPRSIEKRVHAPAGQLHDRDQGTPWGGTHARKYNGSSDNRGEDRARA